jgi:hypothetical protein
MQATRYLFKRLARMCQSIHARRLRALMSAVEALPRGRRLTLTGLGRCLKSKAKVKHNIKRIDRLLGNEKLFDECLPVYGATARMVMNGARRVVIIVDWTELAWNQKFHLLRAAIPIGGRAITIYEEVHPRIAYNSRRVHRGFLQRLANVVGDSCQPIVVTDAGFRAPWFRAVEEFGWDWIGRLRNTTKVRESGNSSWVPCKTLYLGANPRARALGAFTVTRSNPVDCFLYLVQSNKRGRIHKTTRGSRSKANRSLKAAARAREPWLLASSLRNTDGMAKKVVKIYRQRMQIEESFRDMKNRRSGFSLRDSRTNSAKRLAILMLINTLSQLAVWLTGCAGRSQLLHHALQANTVRDRTVLSTFFIGCQLISKKFRFYEHQVVDALRQLNAAVSGAAP